MTAIVLAGGIGTRLKSVVNHIPKPMALINGKPFLEYLLRHLQRNKITEIILSVGYKNDIIRSYFGTHFNDIPISYSVEDKPLGTGGAIRLALEKCDPCNVFICNGDTYFDVNLAKLERYHLQTGTDISISLKEMNNADRYGLVEIKGGLVSSFLEKGCKDHGFINGGVYIVNKSIFNSFNLPDRFSFERFLEENLNRIKVCGFPSVGNFIDIGIPEDYESAQALMPKWVIL